MKCDRLFTERSDLTNYQTQHQTGTFARGFTTFYYGISILIPKCNEIYTRYKNSKLNMNKIPGQKSFKNDTKCIIYTHHVSDIGPYEACTLCIQIHWVTSIYW